MASKENFRGAAAGLFFAGVVLAGVNYLLPTATGNGQSTDASVTATDTDAEEAIAFLQEEGYTTLSSEEYNELTEEVSTLTTQIESLEQLQAEAEGNSEEAEDNASDSEASDSDIVYNSVLSIIPGMTTQEISEQLVALNIIDDADELTNEIFDRELEQRVQIGTYTLDSEMSINEIVETITSS